MGSGEIHPAQVFQANNRRRVSVARFSISHPADKKVTKRKDNKFATSIKQTIQLIDTLTHSMRETSFAFEARMASIYDPTKLAIELTQTDSGFSTSLAQNVTHSKYMALEKVLHPSIAIDRVRRMLSLKDVPSYHLIPLRRHGSVEQARAKRRFALLVFMISKLLHHWKEGTMPLHDQNNKAEIRDVIKHCLSEIVISDKIKEFLKLDLVENKDDAFMLNRVLTHRNRSFAQFPYQQRMRICKHVWFETHKKGTVMIKEGQSPIYVYFIITGQVQIIKTGLEGPVEAGVLCSGAMFGRPEMGSMYQTRKATMVCSAKSQFLVMDVNDFTRIILDQDTPDELNERKRYLTSIDLFKTEDAIIDQAAQSSQLKCFDRGSLIVVNFIHFRMLNNPTSICILSFQVKFD